MIDGIQPATVLEVGQIMAQELRKDFCRDRREIIDFINRFREDLYLLYPEFKLFTNKFYCLELSKYRQGCLDKTTCFDSDEYYGVTLPEDVDGVVSVWEDGTPLRTYSKWWEGRVGLATNDNPRAELSATLVHEQFATERDLKEPTRLKLFASSPEDHGKVVVLNVRTAFHPSEEIRVTLKGDNFVSTDTVTSKVNSVILPSGLNGTVILAQEDGYELSEYSGFRTIPSFRRLKIDIPDQGRCDVKRVLVQGNQHFTPVHYDHDIVEVGSKRIVEVAARMYRYGETGTDPEEMRKADLEEARMKKLIRGALERTRGNSKQDTGQFVRRSLVRSRRTLRGYEALDFKRRSDNPIKRLLF